jgi:PAS domain-containing protein
MMGVTVPMVVMAFLRGRRAGTASIALTETPARPGIDEQLFHILDSALDAVIEIDPEGRVLRWNRQAEELFGSGSVFG